MAGLDPAIHAAPVPRGNKSDRVYRLDGRITSGLKAWHRGHRTTWIPGSAGMTPNMINDSELRPLNDSNQQHNR